MLSHQLNLWNEVVNSMWFRYCAKILLLNKKDVIRHKIENQGMQFSNFFPLYMGTTCEVNNLLGPNQFDSIVQFIQNMFEQQNHSIDGQVYTHLLEATDTSNMEVSKIFAG